MIITVYGKKYDHFAGIVTDNNGHIIDSNTPEYKLVRNRVLAREREKAKHTAYTDCGLIRVKGNLGGTYYE